MRFASRRRHRGIGDIMMTPFLDLFLNILIFLLVTTTFNVDTLFKVDLPEAKASQGKGKEERIVIAVGANGDLALNRRSVTLEELAATLRARPEEERPRLPVVIRADTDSRHGRVVAVMDLLRVEGFRNVGIATRQKKETN